MTNNKSKLLKLASFIVAVSIIATGCGDSNQSASNNKTNGDNVAATSSPTASPSDESATTGGAPEPTTVPTPTVPPATIAPPTESSNPATQAPTKEPNVKPTAKPTQKPEIKPSQKPTLKPSEKPITKPTPKPTEKPSKPNPTPKPTGKPAPNGGKDNVAISDIAAKIDKEIKNLSLMDVDKAMIPDMYNDIDPDKLLSESLFKQAMIILSSSEYSIVKLKSGDNYETIEEAFKFRAEVVKKSFEFYLPNQYELAKNYQIIRNGNYVLFSISEQQDDIADIFNSYFK
ncbi:DUF4358 domain-containing protein [Paenibacillus sp. L3-i20]|uniref:DUF4358 domain-containing protein n=1 Tax=Paenibacillus sp. L3-i20 TaxID=2905833 RepID=UPI001EDDA6AA|nr:DUF4358 domain-containing protein [Paenibacillus sp. L3-i20]GKU76190.1 hypothetical protein L3i20_v205870 [Paenibacillus sp. L3-i20]